MTTAANRTVEVRYRRYSDHRGRPIWVRATRAPGSAWREHWTADQLMRADLSRSGDEDTSPRPSVVHRSASEPLAGPKPRRTIPNSPKTDREGHR